MRIVHTESILEADAIYYAEGDPEVVSLCERKRSFDGVVDSA